jgi:iron complex transport system substrate-binding protein
MGLRALLAGAALSLLLACSSSAASGPAVGSLGFLELQQADSGGFAEAGRVPDGQLTAWAALGLVAADGSPAARARALAFLRSAPVDRTAQTDLALRVAALAALGERPVALLEELRRHRPGTLVNATIWTVLALQGAGERAPPALVRAVLAAQAKGGGWPWSRRGQPDSNDTAAAIQALRAAGVTGVAIRRGVTALRSFQNRDGGFGLMQGRASDAQSTAWAIQALTAAGERVGKRPFRFLSRLRRPDGSYRYSVAYATTPVWVTAQVLPALAGKPFPLR